MKFAELKLVIEAEASAEKPEHYIDDASSLLTLLFELCVYLKMDDLYKDMRAFFTEQEINLQLMYPSDRFWKWLFNGEPSDKNDEGDMEHSIKLGSDIEEMKKAIEKRFNHFDLKYLKEILHGHDYLMTLLACKYYRVRIPPFFWRSLFLEISPNWTNKKRTRKKASASNSSGEQIR